MGEISFATLSAA